ncbi:MAG: glycosyltransferase family 2 protein [Bacteroidales bacterium]|nr:glycosyltransferase family 2 protein [Bacteroidales bacterium]
MISRFDISARPSSEEIRRIAASTEGDFTLLYAKPTELQFVDRALERMVQVAEYTGAAMVYADHFNRVGELVTEAPVIDYQAGALRDDFDFGGVQLYRSSALREAAARMTEDYKYAGLYDLRLKVSQKGSLVHINEYLYFEVETDTRKSGEKLFDYVDPRNREVQIEMERACTGHLRDIGALLRPPFRDVDLSEGEFRYEASVVIPCRNRVRTIADAIRSALGQKTDFPYNVIVVDDHSTDGTVDEIRRFTGDPRLVFIQQGPGYHAIGGNWNAAIAHPDCGRFALQLDSDDVYSDENTVQRFVDAFRAQKAAMIIGTYRITDFDLNTIPPGVIDHREWTDDNGMNNALRINGLGAPRGFWTPLLRRIGFPVVKYGEDYAVALRICREYRIGRIYDVMYNCRRWDDNSDASLSVEKTNLNNTFKDRIRTWELQARMRMLKG